MDLAVFRRKLRQFIIKKNLQQSSSDTYISSSPQLTTQSPSLTDNVTVKIFWLLVKIFLS